MAQPLPWHRHHAALASRLATASMTCAKVTGSTWAPPTPRGSSRRNSPASTSASCTASGTLPRRSLSAAPASIAGPRLSTRSSRSWRLGPGPAPSRQDLLERVESLGPAIEAGAAESDRLGKVPDAVQDALVEAGLFRLLLPRGVGGAQVDPVTFAQVIEAVAKRDASAAWCLCQGNGCAMTAGYLKPDVAHEIFGTDPRAILAWGPGPGKAVAVDGGFRVTGNWAFARGGPHP